ITLGESIPFGDYNVFIKNFYLGQMDVIVGNQTASNVPIKRFDWTDPVGVSINTAGDQTDRIIVRYYPNQIALDTGVAQDQGYIIQGCYITNDLGERIQGYDTIVKLLPNAPPMPRGPGFNYIEDASFEEGLGHGWGQSLGFHSYPITDSVDAT